MADWLASQVVGRQHRLADRANGLAMRIATREQAEWATTQPDGVQRLGNIPEIVREMGLQTPTVTAPRRHAAIDLTDASSPVRQNGHLEVDTDPEPATV